MPSYDAMNNAKNVGDLGRKRGQPLGFTVALDLDRGTRTKDEWILSPELWWASPEKGKLARSGVAGIGRRAGRRRRPVLGMARRRRPDKEAAVAGELPGGARQAGWRGRRGGSWLVQAAVRTRPAPGGCVWRMEEGETRV